MGNTAAAAAPDAEASSITFIGTATVILRLGGYTILTDPNFLHKGDRAYLGYGLSTPRLTEPALSMDQLPPIDLVVLSHFHGDHFDQLVERRLNRSLPIVTTPQAAAKLRRRGFTAVHGLGRWQSIEVTKPVASAAVAVAGSASAASSAVPATAASRLVTSGAVPGAVSPPPDSSASAGAPAASGSTSRLRITALPGRHGPPVMAKALPQVMGSLLEFDRPTPGTPPWRLYISGDTLVFNDLREIPRRYPDIDLALLHLGGTRVFGVLVTMDAAQGVRLLQLLQPGLAIPIHYDDYPVFKSPLADFQRAVQRAGLESKVKYLRRGETYRFDVGGGQR